MTLWCRLNRELADFVSFISPTDAEHKLRSHIVARLKETVRQLWPDMKLEVFGSFDTHLYLPSSDMDVVVLQDNDDEEISRNDIGKKLLKLAKILKSDGFVFEDDEEEETECEAESGDDTRPLPYDTPAVLPRKRTRDDFERKKKKVKNMEVLLRARIPIIKFIDKMGQFMVDISICATGGPRSSSIVRAWLVTYPALRYFMQIFLFILKDPWLWLSSNFFSTEA